MNVIKIYKYKIQLIGRLFHINSVICPKSKCFSFDIIDVCYTISAKYFFNITKQTNKL